jgi:hypothetical protein
MHWFSGAVDLSHNMLSGSCCPEAWHHWGYLKGLYLEHNMLQGPLPSIYSNWSRLLELDLASNPLNTTVPPVFLGNTHTWMQTTNTYMHPSVRSISTTALFRELCPLFG